ncbi:MAG: D-aminoacyl-tRNA deacylase [Actinobacteria bacterium]|nr:D-aminoacyl-tRNA deacylase [Actinomycetota bacterium]
MRVVAQRVRRAAVTVGGEVVGSCDRGFVILLGVAAEDGETHADHLAAKIARLRIFENEEGRFDRSLLEIAGEALVVSLSRGELHEIAVGLSLPD